MMIESAVRDLRAVFADFRTAAQDFLGRPRTSAISLVWREHLSLLLLIPIFSFLCPYRWATGGHLSIRRHLLLPMILAGAFMILAVLYDRICEFGRPPEMNQPIRTRNIALFLHLPVAGCAPFFFLHPLAGYGMILVAGFFSIILSVRTASLIHNVTYARAATRYLSAVILILVPMTFMAAFLSVGRSVLTLERIFS